MTGNQNARIVVGSRPEWTRAGTERGSKVVIDPVMDTLTPAERSQRMSLVRGKDTKPEMLVRVLVHRMGFRYRLHDRSLPGNPETVLPGSALLTWGHGD